MFLLAVSLAAAGATEASVSAAGAVSVAAPPWAQGGFTESAMANVSAVREQIKALPFLQELVAGTLPKASFAFYLTQDSLYLRQYSKVLAALASRAPTVAVTQNMARAADMALVVEGALHEHASVEDAAVVARPDATWGETPCAFVALKPGAPPASEAELIVFARARLAGFKAPRHVVFGPLPKTSTGKVQKFVLRERARELAAAAAAPPA